MEKEPKIDWSLTVPKVVKKRGSIYRSWKDYFYENIRDFFQNTEGSEIAETTDITETAETKENFINL